MSAPATTADADSDAKGAGGSGLTFPQIAAGALAAATASILGSFMGVLGTIGGAAAASIVSTVGAALYQRSLERTRDKVKERLVVSPAGNQVATAVARVTGQGQAGATSVASGSARPGVAGARPGGPVSTGAPPRAVPGAPGPRPGGPFSPPPGVPPRPVVPGSQHADRGRPLPPEQQLRAGGRTVATQVHTQVNGQGAPTRVGPPPHLPQGGIPNARTTGTPPGGIQPSTRMPPPGPNGWGDDAATQLTHVTHEGEKPARRFGKRTWLTLAGVGISVFVIGILASFGVESATGHPLSGGSNGTSVGSIFGQRTGTATATTEPSSTESSTDGSSETSTSSTDPSGSAESTGSNRDQDGSSQRTTRQRSSSDSDNGDSGAGGGGLVPTQLLPRFGNSGATNG